MIMPIERITNEFFIFDTLLAINDLLWSTQCSMVGTEFTKIEKNLTELYIQLDIFRDLVDNRYIGFDKNQKLADSYNKKIMPLFIIISEQLSRFPEKYSKSSMSMKQFQSIPQLKDLFMIE